MVRFPVRGVAELRFEGCEPGVVEDGFPALDELPCAGVVGAFLDGVVDPAYGDVVLELVVEDGLEGRYDLGAFSLWDICFRAGFLRLWTGGILGWERPTQTPPMSKRIAFGGAMGGWCRKGYCDIMALSKVLV